MTGVYIFSITCRYRGLLHGSQPASCQISFLPVFQKPSPPSNLDSLVRQLLEMLEIVTDMESTYLTKIDINARLQHILYARNSKQMQIPEGFSVPWDETLCKRAMDSDTLFSNEVPDRWPECEAAKALGITTYMSVPVHG